MELVSKSIWFILLGIKLDAEEWEWAKQAGKLAIAYTMPRIAHVLLCNVLARRVGAMRRNSVTILCRRPAIVALFKEFDASFGEYKNVNIEAAMDEFLFGVNLV